MVDSLQRLREPAAILVLAAAVARFLVALLALAFPEMLGGYPDLWLTASLFVLDPTMSAVLAVLVALCVLWRPTAHARLLALFALVALCVAAALAVIFAVLAVVLGGVANGAWAYPFWRMADLAVPLVAIVVLARLLGGRAHAQTSQLGPRSLTQPGMPATSGAPQGDAGAPHPGELTLTDQPTWQPHAAAGAAWYSAQDAAAGAAASGWGTPGEPASWSPVPPEAPQPPAEASDRRLLDPPPDAGRWDQSSS